MTVDGAPDCGEPEDVAASGQGVVLGDTGTGGARWPAPASDPLSGTRDVGSVAGGVFGGVAAGGGLALGLFDALGDGVQETGQGAHGGGTLLVWVRDGETEGQLVDEAAGEPASELSGELTGRAA